MCEKKGIVLNRMYTGSYLSTNLGHEVINMFQADDGKHYLYLNAKGNFSTRGKDVDIMLLVRHIGGSSVEVIRMAKNLNYIPSACCSLPRDLGIINHTVRNQQVGKNGLGIKYRGVPIEDIFEGEGQQSIYVSYWIENRKKIDDENIVYNFYKPREGNRLIIELTKEGATQPPKKANDKTVVLKSNFASTSLHQFIFDEEDLAKLREVCDVKENDSFWEPECEKIELSEGFKEHKISLFDICQIQNDENRVSNALCYFILKYRALWKKFLEEMLCEKGGDKGQAIQLGNIISVTREKNAKIEGNDDTGGRIDLLIQTNNSYIIIENKIDSDIITNGEGSQLKRYYNYVRHLKEEDKKHLKKKRDKCRKDIDSLGERVRNREEKEKDLQNQIDRLNEDIRQIEAKEIIGFVLYPNYNPQDERLFKISDDFEYWKLTYRDIYDWLKKHAAAELSDDVNFEAFHNAIKRHGFDYESQALYEEMKTAFFTRIKEYRQRKYFTKSAFAMSLECPRRLYYAYDNEHYANQDVNDEFLKSLAEGGFQVGEFSKLCYGIGPANMIAELDVDVALKKTKDFLQYENVNIAEAAFRVGNMFVRADIIEKKSDVINLIEVKAKSWNPLKDSFVAKNGKSTNKAIRPYLYDVAFQKYVIVQALKEMFPEKSFTVNAFLMLADKSRTATVNGLNQLFKIKSEPNKRSKIIVADKAHEVVETIPLSDRIVRPFDVDDICDKIIAGEYEEQNDPEFMMGLGFQSFVKIISDDYCNHKKTNCIIGSKCFSCPFHKTSKDMSQDKSKKILDGYCECWVEKAGFDPSVTVKPLIKDLSGQYIGTKRDEFVKTGIFFMESLTDADLKTHSDKKHDGLDHYERKWLQIGVATQNENILKEYRHNMVGDTYLDIPGLKDEMKEWKFPLHFIDFETSAVALPFYANMRPYEQIAFQFSHHRVDLNEDGTYEVTHAGQFINTEKGHFPNFDFIRALKSELDKDNGTILRYSNHENTILREIRRQLEARNEPDKKELQDFIDSITHYEEDKVKYVGERDIVDLADVVLKYYFHPIMKGSYSIKVVLPAVQNSSDFIKEKYSEPVYGTPDMPSANLCEPKVWIEYGPDGSVLSPYKLLPPVSSYLGIEMDLDELELNVTESVANGGAALAAYAKMQFSDDAMSEALTKALLTYCELDTLAMVFIWEYFWNECNKSIR